MRLFFVSLAAALVCPAPAQTPAGIDPGLYAGMRWRLVGPFRGGKATMASGVPGNPAVYYFGTAGQRRLEDRRRRPGVELC